jgi:hypothetical protein
MLTGPPHIVKLDSVVDGDANVSEIKGDFLPQPHSAA